MGRSRSVGIVFQPAADVTYRAEGGADAIIMLWDWPW